MSRFTRACNFPMKPGAETVRIEMPDSAAIAQAIEKLEDTASRLSGDMYRVEKTVAAIEALEKRVDAAIHTASVASNAGAGMAERLKAIEEQVRLFNLRLDGHYERHVGLDERIDPLEDRVRAIAADLSRLEQRTALPPKPEPLADGCYVVRWSAEGSLWVARLTAGRWQTNTGPGQWSNPVESGTRPAPHWIGPRVDLPK